MEWQIAIGANLYKGYDLKKVFESLSNLGIKYVDLDFIKTPSAFKKSGYFAHITEENIDKAENIKKMMKDYGLESVTFSGHMYLIEEDDVKLFLKKMGFAKSIGAQYISTNEGPRNREKDFFNNLKVIEQKAREIDLNVCLETEMPGDIIQSGEDGIRILERVNSPYIRMTYDFGNTFYSHKGKINLVEDFKKSLDFLGNIHFKDVSLENGVLKNCVIGEGEINFVKIGQILKENGKMFPITIEIPYFFQSKNWSSFDTLDEVRPLEEIEEMVKQSFCFTKNILK